MDSVVPSLAVMPTRITEDDGRSVPVSGLPIAEQVLIERRIRLRNALITFMNYYDDTPKELMQRMLIVTELDPEMTSNVEGMLGLPDTGDHNELFENYRLKYWSRKCLAYHSTNLILCINGAIYVDDVEIMGKLIKIYPSLISVSGYVIQAAEHGSFDVLRQMIETRKAKIKNPFGTEKWAKTIISCLKKIVKYDDLDIVEYLLALTKIGMVDLTLIAEVAVENNQVGMTDFFVKRLKLVKEELNNFMIKAAENWALDVVKYLIEGGATNYERAMEVGAMYGAENIVFYLMDTYDIDLETFNNALSYAGNYGHVGIARRILQQINDVDPDMLLHNAASEGRLEVVKLAIEYGASELIDAAKEARDNEHVDVLRYLTTSGLVKITDL